MPRRQSKPAHAPIDSNVLEMPGAGDFRRLFAQSSVRHNFNMTLTGPMLETLCAIADGFVRDREFHWTFSAVTPGNFVTSCEPLIKRGLVYHEQSLVRKGVLPPTVPRTSEQLDSDLKSGRCVNYKLTPIGEAFVAMLKVAGLFVRCDAALARNGRP